MSEGVGTILRNGVLAGLAGSVTISLYLGITLPLFFRVPAIALFQWDASNIVGPGAFDGGAATALLGFFFDCVVAACWGLAWACTLEWLPVVRRPAFAWGLAFGVVVMLVMQNLIVPLGRAAPAHHAMAQALNVLVAHTLFFGVPVALCARALRRASN